MFEAFTKVDSIDVAKIMADMPYTHQAVAPALRDILKALADSDAEFEVKVDEESRGYSGNYRVTIRNTANQYGIEFYKERGTFSSDPSGFVVSLSNGKKDDKVFRFFGNTRWYNENGMNLAKSAMNGWWDGVTQYLPYPSGMQDGYELSDGTKTDDGINKALSSNVAGLKKALTDLWKSFGKEVYKKKEAKEKEGKNDYPRVAFRGIDVYTPAYLHGKEPADIVAANKALVKEVTGHDFWEMLVSASTAVQANQKMLDKLADTKIPLKNRILAVVKYTEPEEMDTYKQDHSGPHATSGTSKHRKAYDLGMLEDSPAKIKKAFDSISKEEWSKLANEVYGGDLQGIRVNSVELQKSSKSKKEQPNLFNQNKLQVHIDYDHTVYYN